MQSTESCVKEDNFTEDDIRENDIREDDIRENDIRSENPPNAGTVDDSAQEVTQAHSPESILRSVLKARSPEARRTIAQQLTDNPDYAPSRSALAFAVQQKGGPAESGRAYKIIKRGLDIAVATTFMILLLPLFVLIALAILITDGAPILYHQSRVGRNGKTFRFYKFRSMVKNAAALQRDLADQNEATGPLFKMRNDPRVTRVGRILRRTSFDELPQLINVLRGEISLIGPRPLLPTEVPTCDMRQKMRFNVQPGLLCLREISGRSALSFEEWMELDLLYVANQSFLTDIQVLLKAIPTVLCGSGAY